MSVSEIMINRYTFNMELLPAICCFTQQHMQPLLTRDGFPIDFGALRNCAYSATKVFMRSGTDVRDEEA